MGQMALSATFHASPHEGRQSAAGTGLHGSSSIQKGAPDTPSVLKRIF